MVDERVLVIPGAFQLVKNYGGFDGIDIWVADNVRKKMKCPTFVVAHSAGANFALTAQDFSNCKFILINPLIKKRGFANLVIRDIRYLLSKEIAMEKIVPPHNWWYALKKAYRLSKIDVLACIKKIPRENIVIIRGARDIFFCEEESAEIIKNENLRLLTADAGHDWNENIANLVKEIVNAGEDKK